MPRAHKDTTRSERPARAAIHSQLCNQSSRRLFWVCRPRPITREGRRRHDGGRANQQDDGHPPHTNSHFYLRSYVSAPTAATPNGVRRGAIPHTLAQAMDSSLTSLARVRTGALAVLIGGALSLVAGCDPNEPDSFAIRFQN